MTTTANQINLKLQKLFEAENMSNTVFDKSAIDNYGPNYVQAHNPLFDAVINRFSSGPSDVTCDRSFFEQVEGNEDADMA